MRRRRVRLAALAAALVVVVAALVGVGWYFSDAFLTVRPYALLPEFEVVAAGPGEVILPRPGADPPQYADTRKAGVVNLLWEGGYGRLGDVVREDDATLTRPLEVVEGAPPEAGAPARIDIAVFRRDPLADLGIPFEEVELRGEAGRLAAWWVDGGSDTAALMLHGRRRADRTETLRAMPTLTEMGFSVLALAYRNHDTSDPSPDALYHYGADEYRDALVALDFLAARGVRRVVLVGYSMGAEVALTALRHWPAEGAPEPVAVVLDSPFLDVRAVIRRGARDLGLPAADALAELALLVGRLRVGVDWGDLDQRRFAADLALPVLLIASVDDATIPIESVDDFADRVAGPLVYRRLEGADHVEGWNLDPAAYEGWLRDFLAPFAPPQAPPQARP